MTENVYQDYRKRLTKEAWIRTVLSSLALAFVALFVSALVFWIIGYKRVWVGAIVFGGVLAIAVPLLYFFKYRPTDKQIAMRIDELGLEERMLTREYLKGKGGFIAEQQDKDALNALKRVNPKLLTVLISIPLIISVSVSGVLSAGMTTVSILTATGKLQSGKEIIGILTKEPVQSFEVEYVDSEGGIVDGELFQIVEKGKDCVGVMAVADEDYAFAFWSDGVTTPFREDKNIDKSFSVIALFMPLQEGEGDGKGDKSDDDGGKPGDKKGDKPSDKPSDKPPENPAGAGKWEPVNQVINGETYYGGTTFDAHYETLLEELAKSEIISDDLKQIIEAYFGTIEQ